MATGSSTSGESWRLNTPDLIQQISLLAYLNKNEEGEKFYKLVTAGRVWYEVYRRVSDQDEIEQARAQCILAIAEYVKKNPRASKEDVAKEVATHIQQFADKIEAM